jgi:hypothetical protein
MISISLDLTKINIMLPTKANQTILEAIAGSEGPVTLGLLPLSAHEEESCIRDVVEHCAGRLNTFIDLLHVLTPAAAAYAIAAGASQAVAQGARFWEPVGERLGIDLSANPSRERLSRAFIAACRNLNIVMPDVDDLAWKNIAPMMAQASILHRWTESLGAGIQTTLRNHPLPDLEDPRALQRFAENLASHTHSQPNLKSILLTEVGPIVVHRLISSCVFNRYEILPAHLVNPMKQAFEGSGRQVTLKSPYVSFSMIRGGFELVLPRQPTKLISHQTYWLVNGNQYSPNLEERLSEFEIGAGKIEVRLKKMASGYPDQEFTLNLALDEPLRVFEEKTMREKSVRIGEETTMPPGNYLLVMKPEASSNDAACEEIRGSYKVLPSVTMRPGLESLIVTYDGVDSILYPALKADIYQSNEEGQFSALLDGKNLHYGNSIGFQAYIPKNQHSGQIGILITTENTTLLEKSTALQVHDQGVYDYSPDLEDALREAIKPLQPGIHFLQIRLTTNAASVVRDFWYWKGLEHISQHLGFRCTEKPLNIDYQASKGICESKDGCGFIPKYTGHKIVIALKGGSSIELLRPGVQATVIDTKDEWQADIQSHENLTVRKSEARVIQFESGGFDEWSLQCNDREFAVLNRNKMRQYIGLDSLLAEFGKSGRVCAVNKDGDVIRLFGFSSGLVASALTLEQDHGRGLEKWTTKVPLEDVGKLGLLVRDFSRSPVSTDADIVLLFDGEHPPECEEEVILDARDGVTAVVRCFPEEENLEARAKVCIQISPEKTATSLLTIDIIQMPPHGEEWRPLHCVDGQNTSQLCIVASGQAPVQSDDYTWWHHLWRVSQHSLKEEDKAIYGKLTEVELSTALDTISRFTTVKYPTRVYFYSARYFTSLSYKLSTRRLSAGHRDDNVWWNAGAKELANYADALETPLIRQFHFTQNSDVLRRIWNDDAVIGSTGRSNVIQSLSLVKDIQKADGRVNYAQAVIHENRHPFELFTSFKNYQEVSAGRAADFQDFDFNLFFNGILKRTLQHAEGGMIHESLPVLSARHLLHSINALNRRVRVLTRASAADAEHPLTKSLQSLSQTHTRLESKIITLNSRIGYRPEGRSANLDHLDRHESLHFPDLPCLNSVQAKQIADLAWAFCVTNRASAHGRMNTIDSGKMLSLFSGNALQTHPINLILSFAPELFSYHIALLDFALFNPNASSTS